MCRGKFSGAKFYYSNCLSLPIFPDLKIKELKKITNSLMQILHKYEKKKNY